MYQQIYTWMNSHFLILSVVVLVLLFVLAALSERFRENCGIKFIYHMSAAVYILALLFLTLGSRSRYDKPILDLKLHLLQLEKFWEKDVWILQGDVGNSLVWLRDNRRRA